jgi:probable selenium-dependent hydroxylase accessory protein YqeC
MDAAAAERLLDILCARGGIICAVGAGGKKTTLRRILDAHLLLGSRPVASTATVMVAGPAADPRVRVVTAPADRLGDLLQVAVRRCGALVFAGPESKPGRFAGIPGDVIAALHAQAGFVVTLVKADGARMRLIKAPKDDEPVLPPGSTTVLPIVSAQVFERPLDERVAHRVDRLAEVVDLRPGDRMGPEAVARLLASPRGALQHVADAAVVPLINAVDDKRRHDLASAAAQAALAATDRFDRVVLSSMTRSGDPIVQVVSR